ncbi:unnamed protein product [Umbelopsis ramanniana]
MNLVLEYNHVPDDIPTTENVTSRPESSKQDKPSTQEQQQHFTKLTSKEKLIALVQRLGDDGHLDLTTAVIPRRYRKDLEWIRRDLQLSLNPLATSDERNWLLLISRCENLAEVDNLLKEMYSKMDLTPQCKYIRLCLASVQPLFETNQLQKKHHGEDWYRLHLYSFIFDKAFKSDTEFDIKRSECLSNVTKLFNDVPGQKLDFILRDVNDDNDFLSTEEKPSLKGVKGDLAKAKSLQKMMLREWRRRIGSDLLINEFEAITCQWEANKLTVFATRKITSDLTVTYRKGMFSMPKNVLHMSEFAKLLLAVLSLRRLVLKNYKKLNLISEAKQRDQVEMLRFDDDNDVILRSDSTADAELDDFVGLEDQMTMDIELEKELLNEIGKMKYESDVKSYVDWEEFIMEKAKRRRVSSASSSR